MNKIFNETLRFRDNFLSPMLKLAVLKNVIRGAKSRFKSPSIKTQMFDKARSYYESLKWQHILDVSKVAEGIRKKPLSYSEQAAILWHDSAKKKTGTKNHAKLGASNARKDLSKWFPPQKVKRISKAIKLHNLDLRIKNPATFLQKIQHFSSPEALLLAISDDVRPADILKTWNKTLKYNIKGSPTDMTPLQLFTFMKLRLDPRKRMPALRYYKPLFLKLNEPFIQWLDGLTLDEVKSRVKDFKKGL